MRVLAHSGLALCVAALAAPIVAGAAPKQKQPKPVQTTANGGGSAGVPARSARPASPAIRATPTAIPVFASECLRRAGIMLVSSSCLADERHDPGPCGARVSRIAPAASRQSSTRCVETAPA